MDFLLNRLSSNPGCAPLPKHHVDGRESSLQSQDGCDSGRRPASALRRRRAGSNVAFEKRTSSMCSRNHFRRLYRLRRGRRADRWRWRSRRMDQGIDDSLSVDQSDNFDLITPRGKDLFVCNGSAGQVLRRAVKYVQRQAIDHQRRNGLDCSRSHRRHVPDRSAPAATAHDPPCIGMISKKLLSIFRST